MVRPRARRPVRLAAATGSSATSRASPYRTAASASKRIPNSSDARAGLNADGALQHPGRTAAGMDAELLEARVEQRRGTGDPHIGGQREVQPGADGGAVDGRDRRQRAVGDGEEAVVDRPQPVLGRLAERGQVGACAERLACAGDDEGMHVGVRLGGIDGCAQPGRDLGGDGVAAVGIVDGDQCDVVFDLYKDAIGHRFRLVIA